MIGRTLAHYDILEKIGEGGMGEIYRARDTRLGREVAIKVLPEDTVTDRKHLAQFRTEAKLLASLDHPNIVTVHSVEEAGGVTFITMALIEGMTLRESMRGSGFEIGAFFLVAIPLAEALAAAHDKGVIHRDLKPDNVMLTREGRVKVLDFGLAKMTEPESKGVSETREAVTTAPLSEEGAVVGTVPYMAPEQLHGETADARTDLFALGVVMYEIAAGVRPFVGKSVPEIMASILHQKPIPMTQHRPEIPRDLDRIVFRCLAKAPARRYQTARDVRNDLEDLERELEWGARAARAASREPVSASIAFPPEVSIRRSQEAATRSYRESRVAEWSKPRYRLDREFVALTLLVDQGEEIESGRWHERSKTRRDLGELLESLEDPALVVLGPPGSGKSTLLRRLELEVAQRGLRGEDDRLTFFIQLNRYKGRTRGEPLPDPEEWLSARWKARAPGLPPLSELLASGRMVLLLDALNEIPGGDASALHEVVLQWKGFLDRIVTDHPGTRMVFSCRTLDYSAPLSTPRVRVPHVVIEPLTDAQVEQFLWKHCPGQAFDVWSRLEDTPQLDLMRSPYFLSLLIDQVEGTGVVPEGRAGLFTGFVRHALRREVERGNPLFSPGSLLADRDVRRITQWTWKTGWDLPERGVLVPKLSDLAYAMQSQRGFGGQVRVSYDDALDLLDHGEAETILKGGLALSVLDEDPGTEDVQYIHQLVQEYFAGRQLRKTPDPDLVRVPWKAAEIEPPLRDLVAALPPGETLPPMETTGWEETAILGAAMAEEPDAYVRELMEANLVLAGRAAGQVEVRERLSPALVDELRNALVERSRGREADLRSRIGAGLALGPLGDPRFEERKGPDGPCLEPPTVAIPAGTYPLGEDEVFDYLEHRVEAQRPRHEVEVAGFQMGRFLVTNAEWKCFMRSGGYEEERWWDTVGAKRWRSGEGTADGTHANVRYWLRQFQADPEKLESLWTIGQMIKESYERWKKRLEMTEEQIEEHLRELYPGGILRKPMQWRDRRFNNPSQPVVGVSWYEARAYCNWLSAQTGERYRLPTEVEWEAAARGREGRRYAWGDGFDPLLGNIAGLKARQPTPVGVFVEGETPEGVSDLTGNVDEWTGSLFGGGIEFETAPFAYPYDAQDGREDPEAGPEIRRVLRGGAWNDGPVLTRTVFRYELHPDYRGNVVGFRVVVG